MPELPEVETTRRGIEPHVLGHTIEHAIVRQPKLRWPVAEELAIQVPKQRVRAVQRRAKYLLLRLDSGSVILHLGMSGSLRILPAGLAAEKHDHVDLVLDNGRCLRFKDPRRFGAILWQDGAEEDHPLLRNLGPEPLSDDFDGSHLHRMARTRRIAVKNLIMDGRVVVGVGNIYANEALFSAGIHPNRACGRISARRYDLLAGCIKQVLAAAIEQGGTTLRDFSRADGSPGYFTLSLKVYGRSGETCEGCGATIRQKRIGQRSSFYCPCCQR